MTSDELRKLADAADLAGDGTTKKWLASRLELFGLAPEVARLLADAMDALDAYHALPDEGTGCPACGLRARLAALGEPS